MADIADISKTFYYKHMYLTDIADTSKTFCHKHAYLADIADIVQQGMNHDKPYFSNVSGVNMFMFMANYYSFL